MDVIYCVAVHFPHQPVSTGRFESEKRSNEHRCLLTTRVKYVSNSTVRFNNLKFEALDALTIYEYHVRKY